MKLKVVHVITRMIIGGAQENTLDTCRLLGPEKYDVELLCGPQTGSEGELLTHVRAAGVRLNVLNCLVREVSPCKDLHAVISLARMMVRKGYHIVHTHSSKAGIVGRAAALIARVPIIVHTVHGWGHHGRMSSLRRNFYIVLERAMAAFTDKLIVVSDRDRQEGLEQGIGRPDQYLTIRSGIDVEEFISAPSARTEILDRTGWPKDSIVVGTVMRLSPQKSPADFVRMAAKVAGKYPAARFLMVGDGPLRAEVERLVANYALGDRLHLTGLRRDVPALMKAMDVFVLSSLWEGLPRVLPQAMAAGLPIVSTRVDGAAEVVQQGLNGFLVPPGDVESLSQHILQLAESPKLRAQFGIEGRQLLDPSFSVRVMVNQIDQLYEQVWAETRRARRSRPLVSPLIPR